MDGGGDIQKYYFNAPNMFLQTQFLLWLYISLLLQIESELNESEFIPQLSVNSALLCFIILILHVFKTLEKESLCTNSNRKLDSD